MSEQWREPGEDSHPAKRSDGKTAQSVARFIQICASQNDLFALDDEGGVHQYNFNAKTWAKLGASRSYEKRA